jgi:hypothetical protein
MIIFCRGWRKFNDKWWSKPSKTLHSILKGITSDIPTGLLLGTGIKMIQSANDNNTLNGLDNKK